MALTHAEHSHWGEVFPRTQWFDVRELEPGVHLVSEPGHVNSFLIQGARSAILLDTGLGVANIRAVAEELTDKPLLVVNSHYHFDHSGGNRLFDEIAIHRDGAELLQRPAPPGLAEGYMEYTQRLVDAWGPYKAADDVFFHLLTVERLIRPRPTGFNPAGYQILPTRPTRLLEDGEVLDLTSSPPPPPGWPTCGTACVASSSATSCDSRTSLRCCRRSPKGLRASWPATWSSETTSTASTPR